MENNSHSAELIRHEIDKDVLEVALEKSPVKPASVVADWCRPDRSHYRLGVEHGPRSFTDLGTITKTAKSWSLETPDGCVFRAKYVDTLIAKL